MPLSILAHALGEYIRPEAAAGGIAGGALGGGMMGGLLGRGL
jgi:hypothetical protein